MSEVCTQCDETVDFSDVAYMGPSDRTSTECSPFQEFIVICRKCDAVLRNVESEAGDD
jgi:hypothetical protein